jgi:hypothetical protein
LLDPEIEKKFGERPSGLAADRYHLEVHWDG